MCNAVDQKGAGRRGIQGNETSYLPFPEDGCHTDKGEHRPSGRAELSRGLCGALFQAAECSVELETQSRKSCRRRVGWQAALRCRTLRVLQDVLQPSSEIAQRVHS